DVPRRDPPVPRCRADVPPLLDAAVLSVHARDAALRRRAARGGVPRAEIRPRLSRLQGGRVALVLNRPRLKNSMQKLLRILRWSALALAGASVIAAATIYFWSSARFHRRVVVMVTPLPRPTDAEAVARGRHVAVLRGCFFCHGADL